MAANKFATMIHRNTNKITLILIYALLEWMLILLLLLNSLFSYLIIRFAEFFGLQPPCLWCTRLDHIFDPHKHNNKNMHRDVVCEVHAREISKLGYCLNHRELVESQDMCEHCLSSRPEFQGGFSKIITLFPWIKEFGVIQNHKERVGENAGEVSFKCCFCGVRLDNSTMLSSCVLLKTSSWDMFLECAQKENVITTEAGDLYDNHIEEEECDSDKKISDFGAHLWDHEKILEDKNESEMLLSELDELGVEVIEKERKENASISISVDEMKELEGGKDAEEEEDEVSETGTVEEKDRSVQACVEEDALVEVSPQQHLEFFLDYSGHKLVPIELVDLITEKSQSKDNVRIADHEKARDQGYTKVCEVEVDEKEDLAVTNRSRLDEMEVLVDLDINEEPKFAMLDSMELEEYENSLVFHAKKDCNLEMKESYFLVSQLPPSENVRDAQEMAVAAPEKHLDDHPASEENEADASIGKEIPDLDTTNEIGNQESVHSYEFALEDPSTCSANLDEADEDDGGPMQVKEQMMELQCASVQDTQHVFNNQPSFHLELNDIEENNIPDMPTSVDSLNQFQNKMLFLEKRDYEESLDGSVTSELEGNDGIVTIECFKSALRAERKSLQALYAELEQERSASAEAANQTMAMINRLQEEKAAMQMEALQYQRMMEEQCDYDQEALQLMNELMVKREREKQELEKELEVYRKKLLHYETKEKMKVFKKGNGSTRSGFSSASCSNAEDSDGLSIDLNQEAKEEGCYRHEEVGNHNTSVDTVTNLEDSLADFEEERLSILAQLKFLEEKLMLLNDGNQQQSENVKAMEGLHEENGNHGDEHAHFNGYANGFVKEMNGKHQQRKIGGQEGKSLLPLFDAISDGNGDIMLNGNGNGFDSNGVGNSYASKFETDNKKVAIEEAVDHLYERLQAYEADRDFVKHCVSSLKKGDKGMELLQEILQHLRDLRNVELHVRYLSNTALI